ncbi:MAG TPA: lysophospholipid acyltransferase family protein [Candidatus Saccharimonadia bacterium]|nr:lysophospholipid acyltransferase family protein [Candidatus Saccharimonadia bacterium]
MKFTYWFFYNLAKLLARGFYNHRVVGDPSLDIPGGVLIVSNHESFFDPPMVGIAFDQELHYLARKSLFSNPVARVLYRALNSIPVDQDRPDMTSLKTVIRFLKEGKRVLVFPEGSRTLDGDMLPGEPGVGLIVAKAGVPVLPVRIFGTRKALPRGGSFPQPADVTLVIGKMWHYDPANYSAYTGKELYMRISEDLMAQVAELHP